MDSWNFVKVVLAFLFLQDKTWSREGNLLSDAWLHNLANKRHNNDSISSSSPPAEEKLAAATTPPNVISAPANWRGTLSPEIPQDCILASHIPPLPAWQACSLLRLHLHGYTHDSKIFSYSLFCLCSNYLLIILFRCTSDSTCLKAYPFSPPIPAITMCPSPSRDAPKSFRSFPPHCHALTQTLGLSHVR